MTRQVKTADEQDAYTGWRHVLKYMDRPGVVKKIKRATHKRERREMKRAIYDELDECKQIMACNGMD